MKKKSNHFDINSLKDTPAGKLNAQLFLELEKNISVLPKRKTNTNPKSKQELEFKIKIFCTENNLTFIKEHTAKLLFGSDRKFRYDFLIPELKLVIEYEGIISDKSGHTTITGYNKDCIKYNEIVLNGWRILRYNTINHGSFNSDIQKFLKLYGRITSR